jgi:hypothetical protein
VRASQDEGERDFERGAVDVRQGHCRAGVLIHHNILLCIFLFNVRRHCRLLRHRRLLLILRLLTIINRFLILIIFREGGGRR